MHTSTKIQTDSPIIPPASNPIYCKQKPKQSQKKHLDLISKSFASENRLTPSKIVKSASFIPPTNVPKALPLRMTQSLELCSSIPTPKLYNTFPDPFFRKLYSLTSKENCKIVRLLNNKKSYYYPLSAESPKNGMQICILGRTSEVFVLYTAMMNKSYTVGIGGNKTVHAGIKIHPRESVDQTPSMVVTFELSIENEINWYKNQKNDDAGLPKNYGIFTYNDKKLQQKVVRVVQEYYSYGSLSTFLFKNQTSITYKDKLSIVYQLARALETVHTKYKRIHRDVGTANIYIKPALHKCYGGRFIAILGDYGSNCSLDADSLRIPRTTSWNCSPELAECISSHVRKHSDSETIELEGELDQLILAQNTSLDIWSLGCVIYLLFMGTPPPWCQETNEGTWKALAMYKQVYEMKKKESSSLPLFSSDELTAYDEVNILIQKTLEFDPHKRFSAKQMADFIQEKISNGS